MQLILGLSHDDFIAKSENDKMEWLKDDKKIFKLLSSTNQGICLISNKSGKLIKNLPGRSLYKLSKSTFNLDEAFQTFPNANLLGGQILAKEAILKNYVSDIFLTKIQLKINSGIKFNLYPLINENFSLIRTFNIEKIKIFHWKLNIYK